MEDKKRTRKKQIEWEERNELLGNLLYLLLCIIIICPICWLVSNYPRTLIILLVG